MMRALPLTLSRYLGRHFLLQVALVLSVMGGLIFITDMIELLRRASGQEDIGFGIVISMSLLKLPYLLQRVLPFAMLIGGIMTMMRLTKSQELIIARSAGVSVWQFLGPLLIAAAGVGILTLTVINPISSTMRARFEHLEAKYFKGRTSSLAVSSSGLWLRQMDEDNPATPMVEAETIVHALRVSPREMRLHDVTIFTFDANDGFIRRVDASMALLHDGYWEVTDALITSPFAVAERHPRQTLPTKLTVTQIQDSFESPESLSFWELTRFIHVMEEAGFSALKHRLYWNSMLALPLFLCSMVLTGAIFSLKPHRMGGVGTLFSIGVLIGFIVYFTTDVVNALALSGTLPVALAAWAMPLIATVVSTVALLHLEDG